MENDLAYTVNIWIDSYDDIFSDFDPRPYAERSISDDFLSEMNKLTREKQDEVRALVFQVPQNERKEKDEDLIRKRLAAHFRSEAAFYERELKKHNSKSVIMLAAGILSLLAAVLVIEAASGKWWQTLLRVVLEPAGWFLAWVGMEKLAFGTKELRQKKNFYARLKKSRIEFDTI